MPKKKTKQKPKKRKKRKSLEECGVFFRQKSSEILNGDYKSKKSLEAQVREKTRQVIQNVYRHIEASNESIDTSGDGLFGMWLDAATGESIDNFVKCVLVEDKYGLSQRWRHRDVSTEEESSVMEYSYRVKRLRSTVEKLVFSFVFSKAQMTDLEAGRLVFNDPRTSNVDFFKLREGVNIFEYLEFLDTLLLTPNEIAEFVDEIYSQNEKLLELASAIDYKEKSMSELAALRFKIPQDQFDVLKEIYRQRLEPDHDRNMLGLVSRFERIYAERTGGTVEDRALHHFIYRKNPFNAVIQDFTYPDPAHNMRVVITGWEGDNAERPAYQYFLDFRQARLADYAIKKQQRLKTKGNKPTKMPKEKIRVKEFCATTLFQREMDDTQELHMMTVGDLPITLHFIGYSGNPEFIEDCRQIARRMLDPSRLSARTTLDDKIRQLGIASAFSKYSGISALRIALTTPEIPLNWGAKLLFDQDKILSYIDISTRENISLVIPDEQSEQKCRGTVYLGDNAKVTGYTAIHTTISDPKTQSRIEQQIRTRLGHYEAVNGVARRDNYKQTVKEQITGGMPGYLFAFKRADGRSPSNRDIKKLRHFMDIIEEEIFEVYKVEAQKLQKTLTQYVSDRDVQAQRLSRAIKFLVNFKSEYPDKAATPGLDETMADLETKIKEYPFMLLAKKGLHSFTDYFAEESFLKDLIRLYGSILGIDEQFMEKFYGMSAGLFQTALTKKLGEYAQKLGGEREAPSELADIGIYASALAWAIANFPFAARYTKILYHAHEMPDRKERLQKVFNGYIQRNATSPAMPIEILTFDSIKGSARLQPALEQASDIILKSNYFEAHPGLPLYYKAMDWERLSDFVQDKEEALGKLRQEGFDLPTSELMYEYLSFLNSPDRHLGFEDKK